MRIVITDTTIDEELIGGGHLYLPKLIGGLVNKGHEVHLVVKGVPNEKVRSYLEASGAIIHKDIWNPNHYVERSAPVLAAWVNELQPDVYFISASADIAWVALPLLNEKIGTLAIGHTDSETFYLPARHYHSFLTGLIGVSPQVCDQYAIHCDLPRDRIFWIPYGVESSTVVDPLINEKLQLLYVGRLEEEQKRISDIGRIIHELESRNLNYFFRIVGDGPDMPRLRQQIEAALKSGNVDLAGWKEGREVLEIMRKSHLFILTSEYEGFCIALTEAMANGCCPLVTRIRSGNEELVANGKNGFLFDIGNVGDFADKISYLDQNRNELQRLRTSAWETGRNYNTEAMVNRYIDCFRSVKETALNENRGMDKSFPLMPTCRSKYPYWIRDLKVAAKNIRSRLFPAY